MRDSHGAKKPQLNLNEQERGGETVYMSKQHVVGKLKEYRRGWGKKSEKGDQG